MCFSPYGSVGQRLLVTSADTTASYWTFSYRDLSLFYPYVTFRRHRDYISGGAFLSDGFHIVTASHDKTIRIWRIAGGMQTEKIKIESVRNSIFSLLVTFAYTFLKVASFSHHAASGLSASGSFAEGNVHFWKTVAQIEPAPEVPFSDHVCLRERRSRAQAKADTLQAWLDQADSGLRQQVPRVQELKRSIADLEAKCT